ncbi:hypothetical protein DPEC_G00029960 [Dallia pectoralis]|uniref:Uncharacterized protein n=1 Tax=Dallia pectoralis TaxID=75939 RepID=A0ACC2HBS2_DALPE|nr:hypothetical protein DPEC_G00029960 [Dallia pectoralis]
MGSWCESTSDLDEDLPVYDFLKPGRMLSHAFQSHTTQPDLLVLDSSDAEMPISSSPVSGAERAVVHQDVGVGWRVADVMMISSEEDELGAPDIPLALRLKQKDLNPPSSFLNNVENNKHSSADPHYGLGLLAPNGHPKCQTIFTSIQAHGHLRMENAGGKVSGLFDLKEPAVSQLCPPMKPSSWDWSTSTSPDKQEPYKRTANAIQASREELLRRELLRREPRKRQQVDKEAHRPDQGRQKLAKKTLAEAVKAMRPEECIKYIVVAVDPALLQLECGGSLLTALQALGCSCCVEKQPIPNSVSWVRRTTNIQTGGVMCIPEAQIVMQVPVDDFINLIYRYTQEQSGGAANCSPCLTSWIQGLMALNPGKNLCLVVIDLEKYFRSQNSQSQKKFRNAVLGEEQAKGKPSGKRSRKKDGVEVLPAVSRVEVEEAVVQLQIHTQVQVHFLSAWKDFSDHITMTTKAVAEAPFKREREETGFSFYLESDWAGGHKVDRAGKGLLQVWKRQIQQLNRVSADMASAILAAYPSPQLLYQEYRHCKSEREKLFLLSDILIRRGEGVTSTTRRVGPELSKRLCLMMTSADPHKTLDSTF